MNIKRQHIVHRIDSNDYIGLLRLHINVAYDVKLVIGDFWNRTQFSPSTISWHVCDATSQLGITLKQNDTATMNSDRMAPETIGVIS